MKISFNKLVTSTGTVSVSLDGGNSFTTYNVADVKDNGIPLSDNQDYSKIVVKGSSVILNNLAVSKSIEIYDEVEVHISSNLTGYADSRVIRFTNDDIPTSNMDLSYLYLKYGDTYYPLSPNSNDDEGLPLVTAGDGVSGTGADDLALQRYNAMVDELNGTELYTIDYDHFEHKENVSEGSVNASNVYKTVYRLRIVED